MAANDGLKRSPVKPYHVAEELEASGHRGPVGGLDGRGVTRFLREERLRGPVEHEEARAGPVVAPQVVGLRRQSRLGLAVPARRCWSYASRFRLSRSPRNCRAIRPTGRSWRCSPRPAPHCGCGRCVREARGRTPPCVSGTCPPCCGKRQAGPASRTGSAGWTYAGAIGPGGPIHEHCCRLTCCDDLLGFRNADSPSRFVALQVDLDRGRVTTYDWRSSGAGATRRQGRATTGHGTSTRGT